MGIKLGCLEFARSYRLIMIETREKPMGKIAF